MGWKSTIDITRDQAINAILRSMPNSFEELSNAELKDMMYKLGIGDDLEKPYYGYNFNIVDKLFDEDDI
jgi:hypothetical protein